METSRSEGTQNTRRIWEMSGTLGKKMQHLENMKIWRRKCKPGGQGNVEEEWSPEYEGNLERYVELEGQPSLENEEKK